MQTFLPYENFNKSARVLDYRRLNKQCTEAYQILNTLNKGKYYCDSCNKTVTHLNPYKTGYHCYDCEAKVKMTGWYNHPAVQMWKNHELYLILYTMAMCLEWGFRFERTHSIYYKLKDFSKKFGESNDRPRWLGNKEFHISHKSNLLRKDKQFYSKFFKDIPDNLPYIWPTKDLN